MRSALVIGAAGQDGRLLTRLLAGRDYALRGWTHTPPREEVECECDAVDLLDERQVERQIDKLQPDEIYYLAAYHHSTEDKVELSRAALLRRSFDVQVVGLVNVLHAIQACRPAARLFYAASSHVFGSSSEMLNESSAHQPNSAYGISKSAGVACCRLYRNEEGVFAATGVLFNHESGLRKPSFLSQKIVRGALRARRDPAFKLVLGNLGARVDWGYARDYVDAMWRILQLPAASDYVIASGETHSVREFARIAFDAVGLDWAQHVEIDASLLKKPPQTHCGDAAKLRDATGWIPTLSFEEMVRALVSDASDSEKRDGVLPPARRSAAGHCGVAERTAKPISRGMCNALQ